MLGRRILALGALDWTHLEIELVLMIRLHEKCPDCDPLQRQEAASGQLDTCTVEYKH